MRVFVLGAVVVAGSLLALGSTLRQPVSGEKDRAKGAAPGERTPVIVELFTSEGCSSCPPADALLAQLESQQPIAQAEVIALEEHVDYWDKLGWNDPFSSAEWTARQQDYARKFGNDGVYTPQMIVDGEREFVGSRKNEAVQSIEKSAERPKAELGVALSGGKSGEVVAVGITAKTLPSGTTEPIDLWLAVTESGLHSHVKAGENSGEDLHHASVVRTLQKVASLTEKTRFPFQAETTAKVQASWHRDKVRVVVFAQGRSSRRVVGAAIAGLN